jgi:YD repeat-containing protein
MESLGYDDDGNLTSDARWTYTWDAENRLIAMEE